MHYLHFSPAHTNVLTACQHAHAKRSPEVEISYNECTMHACHCATCSHACSNDTSSHSAVLAAAVPPPAAASGPTGTAAAAAPAPAPAAGPSDAANVTTCMDLLRKSPDVRRTLRGGARHGSCCSCCSCCGCCPAGAAARRSAMTGASACPGCACDEDGWGPPLASALWSGCAGFGRDSLSSWVSLPSRSFSSSCCMSELESGARARLPHNALFRMGCGNGFDTDRFTAARVAVMKLMKSATSIASGALAERNTSSTVTGPLVGRVTSKTGIYNTSASFSRSSSFSWLRGCKQGGMIFKLWTICTAPVRQTLPGMLFLY
mmetsp:Transcript_23432/g.51443  ORF Transcript_23432/g.51443 Transcript_23432/m.51443 type:complete len:319 (+) Transcript_23432:851-1807(+)